MTTNPSDRLTQVENLLLQMSQQQAEFQQTVRERDLQQVGFQHGVSAFQESMAGTLGRARSPAGLSFSEESSAFQESWQEH